MYVHCYALSICQLPNCNLFTQHVSILLWRDTTSELWTPVHSFISEIQPTAIIVLLHSLQANIIFHTIRLILCFQQAGEIDTLTVSLGQSSLVVLCAGSKSTSQTFLYKHLFLTPLTPSEHRRSPTGLITLVSLLREDLLLHSSNLTLEVSWRTCASHASRRSLGGRSNQLD